MVKVRKPSPKKLSLSTLVIISVILLAMIFLFHDFQYRDAQAKTDAMNQFIEDLLPEQATDVRFTTQSAFQTNRWKLRFAIPAASLSDFIENSCPTMILTEGGYISLYNDETIEWWRPEDARIYTSGGCVENNIEIYQVLGVCQSLSRLWCK